MSNQTHFLLDHYSDNDFAGFSSSREMKPKKQDT